MLDVFGSSAENPYQSIYESLAEVRELFHREGRISDANAKLDETVKLLAIHYAGTVGLIGAKEYSDLKIEKGFDLSKLQKIFLRIAASAPFVGADGTSIFGSRPSLGFEAGDERVAFRLFVATGRAFIAQSKGTHSLDVLNEAFGHHVRDNFRSHTEDAQYMTPPEVVEFMVKLASNALIGSKELGGRKRLVMMDPACGVGSFIAAWRREYEQCRARDKKLPPLIAVGQDKVDRMARLAAMNLMFSGRREDQIFYGNSLFDGSAIDKYNGQVDLILTNPPFGAKFPADEVRMQGLSSTPIFASSSLSIRTIDSELLFIDRYLSLLRDGGHCLVIVPDGVISAKGTAAFLRQRLARTAILRGIIELPPVTFSQAGTRTKTAVLHFQKCDAGASGSNSVFFGEVDDLGFSVSKRKGVPIKRSEGSNQLPAVVSAVVSKKDRAADLQGRSITAVWRKVDLTGQESWTPRQFKVDAGRVQQKAKGKSFALVKLSDLVEARVHRRPERHRPGVLFISVLHVIGEGVLDVAGVKDYQPITPGLPIAPREVIISRINPRIPRVLVVPDLAQPLLCSSEFEIFRPRPEVSPYALAYLLMSEPVQSQIRSLTAGTSASHSRVKPEKLYDIQIPWPRTSRGIEEFSQLTSRYADAMQNLVQAVMTVSNLREAGREWPPTGRS